MTNAFAFLRLLLPRQALQRLRLLVHPDTILRWHRDLLARRHAAVSHSRRRGRPRTLRSIRNLVMNLHDAGSTARYLIRDRDSKFPALLDAVLADSGITVVRSGVQIPRMNAVMER